MAVSYYVVRVYREAPAQSGIGEGFTLEGLVEDTEGRGAAFHSAEELASLLRGGALARRAARVERENDE